MHISVDSGVVERLSKWYSGDIHDCLDRLGIWGAVEGLTQFGHLPPEGKICGPATTVQFVPCQAKITSRRYHRAIDEVPKGGVLVIDTAGARGSCTGELMCTGALCHGAVATVVNGTIRDLAEIEALQHYPVFATGVLPVTAVGRMEDTAVNVDINFRGIRVQPGDIIFADRDGVVVVPREAAEAVARLADEIGRMERNFKQQILGGVPLVEVFNDV
jgi:4-hydroxy-4-methyl-2-oxoglutarate aldolase